MCYKSESRPIDDIPEHINKIQMNLYEEKGEGNDYDHENDELGNTHFQSHDVIAQPFIKLGSIKSIDVTQNKYDYANAYGIIQVLVSHEA